MQSKSKQCTVSSNNLASPLRETHMPYGITQVFMPPGRREHPAFTPSRSRYRVLNLATPEVFKAELTSVWCVVHWDLYMSALLCKLCATYTRDYLLLCLFQVKQQHNYCSSNVHSSLHHHLWISTCVQLHCLACQTVYSHHNSQPTQYWLFAECGDC